ncbi:serine protease inhibitor 28Dc-like [Wyeomyia smithii]|uniref:serine protease inhibitor 28Dc-like n=1 Tax=Wyeomyia smithii TaxID=174621 RepID=UPI002467E706|nr:serine protease inhibitor 28Dc-like [Wyeomyia smithii]
MLGAVVLVLLSVFSTIDAQNSSPLVKAPSRTQLNPYRVQWYQLKPNQPQAQQQPQQLPVSSVQQQQQQQQQQQAQQQQQGQSFSAPSPSQGQPQFQYDAASFTVTDLARRIGTVLGQQSNAAVFSPVSIACALSLLLLAADKETKRELLQVLNFPPDKTQRNGIHHQYGKMLREVASSAPDVYPIPWRQTDRCNEYDDEDDFQQEIQIIHLANAIFVKRDLALNGRYVELSQKFYNSTVNQMDFANNPQQSASSINQWASDNTYGKINQIVSSYINTDTQMIVANALYFKGLWKEAFEKQATSYKKFYPDGYANPSTVKEVLSMAVIGCFPYYDAVQYDAKIVGLPYQGDKTALYIIIPNNSSRAKLQRFQSTLTGKDIGDMVVKMTVRKVLIQMPKMKISNTINLRDVLQKLNLRTIFSPTSSDLSGMLDQTDRNRNGFQDNPLRMPLYASEIIHKVELEINEKGTEGGAVTASTIFRSLPSVTVRIDTPFLMLLGHDATRLPLFYGSIYDPSS